MPLHPSLVLLFCPSPDLAFCNAVVQYHQKNVEDVPSLERGSMSLHEEMTRAGHLLFRWRSYLPLLLFPLFMVTLRNFTYLENSEALDDLWEVVCLGIAGVGFLLRVLTVGFVPANTSGRATREPTAATLNTTGLYSVVRHPLY